MDLASAHHSTGKGVKGVCARYGQSPKQTKPERNEYYDLAAEEELPINAPYLTNK